MGSWTAIAKYLTEDASANRANSPLHTIESGNNIVFSQPTKRIALLGVNDLIIVNTADALLICSRHEAERIKELVGKVPVELQ